MTGEANTHAPSETRWLTWLGVAGVPIYGVIAALTSSFGPESIPGDRPLLAVLALFTLATILYLAAMARILSTAGTERGPHLDRGPRIVLLFALLYRLILLPSWPIQEIDFYRYLWDGRVTLNGFNPFHYSPGEIDGTAFEEVGAGDSEERAALERLSRQSETVHLIFERVHQRDVPTAYPPVAQAVFAAVVALTPAAAPVWVHLLILKAALVALDLGTVMVLAALLRRLALPATWCLAYAWCPLALKEIANSGHFDAIAVFLTTLALYLLVASKKKQPGAGAGPLPTADSEDDSLTRASAALAVLALAVLAKSYPIVLLPMVSAYLWAKYRIRAALPLLGFVVVLVAGYVPFTTTGQRQEAHHAGTGLGEFLVKRGWAMNDLLFMIVQENVSRQGPEHRWFVVVPASWREALHVHLLDAWVDFMPEADPAYVLTLAIMGAVLVAIALTQCWKVLRGPKIKGSDPLVRSGSCELAGLLPGLRACRRPAVSQAARKPAGSDPFIFGPLKRAEPVVLLRGCFLVLAWGWLLGSTQNPWYLLWGLPLMVFARCRAWFLLPGLAFVYYLRFWMEYRAPEAENKAWAAFDYGMVWVEYLPFFVCLVAESWLRRLCEKGPRTGAGTEGRIERMRRKWIGAIGTLILIVGGYVGFRAFNRPRLLVSAETGGERLSLAEVDHSGYDALLQRYVDRRGLVAYAKWKANAEDVNALQRYLDQLSHADPALPADRPAQFAYWINAYNAMTLKGILDVYPTDSILSQASPVRYDPRLRINLWFDLLLPVAGKEYSLTMIEHEVLRKMDEPKIHFALVCASLGCPPLRNHAYRAEDLDAVLSDNARRFFAREDNFQADPDGRTIFLSPLLEWYEKDFGQTPAERLQRLRPYFPEPETLGWLSDGPVKVKFLNYDWALNDQAPGGG